MSTVTDINKTEAHEQIILANPYGLTATDTLHLSIETRNSEVLAILSRDDDEMVRENVAANLHIDYKTIAYLATTERAEGVRNNLAANPATPAHILKAMRTDGITWDYFIAQNPKASAVLLDSLASKHGDNVTTDTAIAKNPNTAVETLNRLAKGYEVTKVAVAKNPNATIETLFLMTVRKEDHDLQRAVVANMNASEVTLDNIARVTYLDDVQVAIAQHPTTHRKTLTYLAVKGTREAREAVQERRAADAAHTQDVEVVAA